MSQTDPITGKPTGRGMSPSKDRTGDMLKGMLSKRKEDQLNNPKRTTGIGKWEGKPVPGMFDTSGKGRKDSMDVFKDTGENTGYTKTESDLKFDKILSDKRSQGIGYTGGAENPNKPGEYGTLWDDGTWLSDQ